MENYYDSWIWSRNNRLNAIYGVTFVIDNALIEKLLIQWQLVYIMNHDYNICLCNIINFYFGKWLEIKLENLDI